MASALCCLHASGYRFLRAWCVCVYAGVCVCCATRSVLCKHMYAHFLTVTSCVHTCMRTSYFLILTCLSTYLFVLIFYVCVDVCVCMCDGGGFVTCSLLLPLQQMSEIVWRTLCRVSFV